MKQANFGFARKSTAPSSRRTNLPEPWRRTDGGTGKIGARYRHSAGYEIHHCGHPTALWPYALYAPSGDMIIAPNGRAWRSLSDAAVEVARLLVVLVLLAFATPAAAQGFDWKPVAVLAAGQSLDTISTQRFLALGTCGERNDRYWGHAGYTWQRPDTGRMWREKAILVGVGAILVYIADHQSNKPARRFLKTATYSVGAVGFYKAAGNIKRCGW